MRAGGASTRQGPVVVPTTSAAPSAVHATRRTAPASAGSGTWRSAALNRFITVTTSVVLSPRSGRRRNATAPPSGDNAGCDSTGRL
jgi:hypothetical protein